MSNSPINQSLGHKAAKRLTSAVVVIHHEMIDDSAAVTDGDVCQVSFRDVEYTVE